jgi:hypothetical protein
MESTRAAQPAGIRTSRARSAPTRD